MVSNTTWFYDQHGGYIRSNSNCWSLRDQIGSSTVFLWGQCCSSYLFSPLFVCLRSGSCVPNVTDVFRLFILDCHFGFRWLLLKTIYHACYSNLVCTVFDWKRLTNWYLFCNYWGKTNISSYKWEIHIVLILHFNRYCNISMFCKY